MKPSSAVHPRADDEEAPLDPSPPSRKARKYIDRKAPKVNFLRKIFWSKKRRWLFYILTLAAFLANGAVILNFTLHIKTHTMPVTVRDIFLGYNFLYNTQAYGTLVGSGWMFQMIWRSWWFYGQWIYSIRVLYLRAYNIKHHEKDIGVWLPKDWKMLYHKLARFLFLIPVALILLVDVMPMTNPPIINKAFFEQCQLTPSYEVGLAGSYTIDSTTPCNDSTIPLTKLLNDLPQAESKYMGYIPDGGPSATGGEIMISMEPVGKCASCATYSPNPVPFFTFDTRPPKVCEPPSYQFSNWITVSDVCDALKYNQFYATSFLKDANFEEQWFCNLNMTKNSTHMTVFFDTAFARANQSHCINALDGFFIQEAPGLRNNTEVSSPIGNLSEVEITVLTGRNYEEFGVCDEVQVSCLQDYFTPTIFWRSVALYGCKRTFQGSLTADTDQRDLDAWFSNWKYAYKLGAAGLALETAWDYVEYLAYIII